MLHLRMIPQGTSSSTSSVQTKPTSEDGYCQVERNSLIPTMTAEPGQVQNTTTHHNVERSKQVLLPRVSSLQLELLSLSCLKGARKHVIVELISIDTISIVLKLNFFLSTVT